MNLKNRDNFNSSAILMAQKHTSLYKNMQTIEKEIADKKREIELNKIEIERLQSTYHPSFSISKNHSEYLDKQYNFLIEQNHELVLKLKDIETRIRDNKFTINQIKAVIDDYKGTSKK